jgi:hypothetical protein
MKGITVKLAVKTAGEPDPLGAPTWTTSWVDVENVLVSPAMGQDLLDTFNLYGKRAVYTLGIPKGDAHVWQDTEVQFFDKTFRTIGLPTGGIEELIPLSWNQKVQVELVEV